GVGRRPLALSCVRSWGRDRSGEGPQVGARGPLLAGPRVIDFSWATARGRRDTTRYRSSVGVLALEWGGGCSRGVSGRGGWAGAARRDRRAAARKRSLVVARVGAGCGRKGARESFAGFPSPH